MGDISCYEFTLASTERMTNFSGFFQGLFDGKISSNKIVPK